MSVLPDVYESLTAGGARTIEGGTLFWDGRFRAWHNLRNREDLPILSEAEIKERDQLPERG